MTNTKLIFEELYRIREMMGIKTNSKQLMTEVRMLLTEGSEDLLKAAYKKLMGLSDEAVTAFAKSEDELTKLTDNILKASGKNTIDELMSSIARAEGKTIDELSQESVEQFLKNSTELTKAIDDWALNFVKASFDETSVRVNLTDVFTKAATDAGDPAIKNIPDNIKNIIDMPIRGGNANNMKEVLKQQQELLSTLQNVDGVADLQRQINTKLNQIDAFQARTKPQTTWEPKPDTLGPRPTATSNVDEVLDDMVDDFISDLKSKYPNLKVKELDEIADAVKNAFKDVPDVATLNKSADDIQQRIERRMREAQEEFNNAKNKRQRTRAKNKKRRMELYKEKFNNVREFCTGRWSDWTDAGPIGKTGIAAKGLGGLVVCQGLLGAGWGVLNTLVGRKGFDGVMCQLLHMDKIFFNTFSDLVCTGENWYTNWTDDDEEDDEDLFEFGPLFKACPNICSERVTDEQKAKKEAEKAKDEVLSKIGKTKEEAEAWINTMNGPGEDLEGLTLEGWEPIEKEKDMYLLTLSDGQQIKVKWDGEEFVPQ